MKRNLPLLLLITATGCVVPAYQPVTYRPPPAPPPRAQVWFSGNHPIPEAVGGGWCYVDGPHQHDYRAEREDYFRVDRGYFTYSGPSVYFYFDGHPMPGGGWCMVRGRHSHDYVAPHDNDWEWARGNGFRYRGPYNMQRPPPPNYWVRPGRPVDVRPPPPPLDDRRRVPPPPAETARERAERERLERERAWDEQDRLDRERERTEKERRDREEREKFEKEKRDRDDRDRAEKEKRDKE